MTLKIVHSDSTEEEASEVPTLKEGDVLMEKQGEYWMPVKTSENRLQCVTGASYTQAFETQLHIKQLSQTAQKSFLLMAELLHEAKERKDWVALEIGSFQEYVDELHLPVENSYSWVTRLIAIHRDIKLKSGVNDTVMQNIGVSKLTRLLPEARKGELTPERIAQAMTLSDKDLRIELGHKMGEPEECSITCPECGRQIFGARFVNKKGKDESAVS